MKQQQQQSQQQFGYGSIANTDEKEVITMNGGGGSSEMLTRRQHRRTNSEISTSSYASATTATSIDRSVDPVMTDMTKSAMFKGVTNRGVVKLQLPKDNFRLLSDRELGEFAIAVVVLDSIDFRSGWLCYTPMHSKSLHRQRSLLLLKTPDVYTNAH